MNDQAEAARADFRLARHWFDQYMIDPATSTGARSFGSALRHLNEARKKDPSVTLLFKDDKGEVHTDTPDGLEARMCYLEAYPVVHDLDRDQCSLPKAIELLERAVALRPSFRDARRNLASLYKKNNQKDRAIELLQESIKLFPDELYYVSDLEILQTYNPPSEPVDPRRQTFIFGNVLLVGSIVTLILSGVFSIGSGLVISVLMIVVSVVILSFADRMQPPEL